MRHSLSSGFIIVYFREEDPEIATLFTTGDHEIVKMYRLVPELSVFKGLADTASFVIVNMFFSKMRADFKFAVKRKD